MDILGLFNCTIGIILVLGLGFTFFAKNEKYINYIISVVTLFTVLITLLSILSLPSNYLLEKIIASVIGLVSIIGLFIQLKCKSRSYMPMLLVAISAIAAYVYMLI